MKIVAAYDPKFAKEILQWVNNNSNKFSDFDVTNMNDPEDLWQVLTTVLYGTDSYSHEYEYDEDFQPSSDGTQCDYIYLGGQCKSLRCGVETEKGSKRCKYHNAPIFSAKLFEPININEMIEKVAKYEQLLSEQAEEIQGLQAKIEDLKYRPGTGTSYQKAKDHFENAQK